VVREIEDRYSNLTPQQQLDAAYLTRQGISLEDALDMAEMYGPSDVSPWVLPVFLCMAAIAVAFGALLAALWG